MTGAASSCAVVGPVVDEFWLGSHGPGACLVRMEVPLAADLMVAALFAAGLFVTAGDVADDGELFGFIAQVVGQEGLGFLEAAAESLPALDRSGTLPAARGMTGADWLAFCRRRIAELTAMPPARLVSGAAQCTNGPLISALPGNGDHDA